MSWNGQSKHKRKFQENGEDHENSDVSAKSAVHHDVQTNEVSQKNDIHWEDGLSEQVYDISSEEEVSDTEFDKSVDHQVKVANMESIQKKDRIQSMAEIFKNFFGSDVEVKPKTVVKETQYIDDGNPTYKCEYCSAIMWYGEHINRKKKTRKRPQFSLCCGQGQVKLPLLKESPLVIKNLLTGNDQKSKYYQVNLRALNMVFSFTSIGGKVDNSCANGIGPQMFQLQGENYHLMGSLKPDIGDSAKFSQLYIVDTENEVDDRDAVISKYKKKMDKVKMHSLRKQIIEDITKVLDDVNPYVKKFRSARERFNMNESQPFHMRIVSNREKDGRTYDTPTASEVAALIPGDFNLDMDKRDIVLQEKQTGWLKRISEIHPSYLALQYPLIFTYGEDGFRLGIKKRATPETKKLKRDHISMRQWFAFRLQERDGECHTLLHSRRLFQQFVVDAFTTIETNRLSFLRLNQKCLRSDTFDSIQQAENDGKVSMNDQGKKFILPASFIRGPRYMKNNYLDAMAICRHFGFPDLFITFTCNPKWPEITRYLSKRNLKTDDRP